MSASVRYFVTVLRTREEVIEVSAVTRLEAEMEAMQESGVVAVVSVHDDDPQWSITDAGRALIAGTD